MRSQETPGDGSFGPPANVTMKQNQAEGTVPISSGQPAPDRFQRARELRDRLAERGVWFAPVRHHSPACARGVLALIREIAPAAVLIEGPSEYDALLPALTDTETHPPVAVLSLRETSEGPASTFFPLADFSPEWVALREAYARGARVAFIDRPWTDKPDTEAQERGLAGERYYAESQALLALARQEHCRDHDELWEHLFELRGSGDGEWRVLFDDVFAWSALARLDYEPEVLLAEGSVPREATMVAHIERWRGSVDGPLVVVTGAFHTLALVEALGVRLLGEKVPEAGDVLKRMPGLGHGDGSSGPRHPTRRSSQTRPEEPSPDAWLIRYDLTQLNALTGYGAGIRSPGFYQRQWDAGDADVTVECLTDIARLANEAGTSDRLSVAETMDAALQAYRLAGLRGHPRPGRADLLDACTSCFGRGDLAPAIRDAIGTVFGGVRLGTVPAGTAAPPIVAEARSTAERLRLNVSDSARRTAVLGVRRSAAARRRSRFLWLMSYLGTGFATRVGGPDYIAGRGLGRVREEWQYAWTPMVEARLIVLIGDGATLHEAARHRLAEAEGGGSRSSKAVAGIIAQAALIGLDDEATRLRGRLDQMIDQDSELGSVLGAAQQLLGLWRSRELLDLADPDELLAVAGRTLPQLAYLLDEAAGVKADDEPAVVDALVGVGDLVRQLNDDLSAAVVGEALARLRTGEGVAPGVAGAALALGVASGEVDDDALGARIRSMFAPGADVDQALRFFNGVMRAAPDLFLHTPELFDAVDRAITGLDSAAFLDFLPELRRSFAHLRPFETAKVAERIAGETGRKSEDIAGGPAVSADDLREGMTVERALIVSLEEDCLLGETPINDGSSGSEPGDGSSGPFAQRENREKPGQGNRPQTHRQNQYSFGEGASI